MNRKSNKFGVKYENEPPVYIDNLLAYKGERIEFAVKEKIIHHEYCCI